MKKLRLIPILALLVIFTLSTLPAMADDKPEKVVIGKQPKDENTRDILIAQGIDPEYVELTKDYGLKSEGKSPYSREYLDIISGKYVLEVQQLPMVNANGELLDTAWYTKDNKNFTAGINQFIASVAINKVTVIVLNDQPDGKVKKDMALSFQPQLYLDGKEVKPAINTPTLLAVDPLNSNYTNNTLEWDYGICKRRLRLIEGRLLGSWVFANRPSGEVRIQYNQTGDFGLTLGQFKFSEDEEIIKPGDFDELAGIGGYPITVRDSATFYPDAHPETTSVDGQAGRNIGNLSWDDVTTGIGNEANDTGVTLLCVYARATNTATPNNWDAVYRGIIIFPTASLPDDAVISAATLSLYGNSSKTDSLGAAPTVSIYEATTSSSTSLAASDYQACGAVVFATAITYAAWLNSEYNVFTLNAAGRANISKTDVSKFSTRNPEYDVANSTPPWVQAKSYLLSALSAESGNGFKPKLVVTYTVLTVTTQAATEIDTITATGNGNITSLGTEANCDIRGIVWDLASHGAPGNVAPAASGYARDVHTHGAFGVGAYTETLTGLPSNDVIYYRAYVRGATSGNYVYGDEVSFTTLSTGVDITHAAATGFGNFATGIGQLLIMILCAFIGVKGLSADEIVAKIMGVVFLGVGLYFLMNSGWMSSAPPLT